MLVDQAGRVLVALPTRSRRLEAPRSKGQVVFFATLSPLRRDPGMHISIELTSIEDVVALFAVIRDKLDPITPLQADVIQSALKGPTDALKAGIQQNTLTP